MKIFFCFILILQLVVTTAFGQVETYLEPFERATVGKTHFWMKVYDWQAWEKSPYQKSLQLIPNYVQKAVESSMNVTDYQALSLNDFSNVVGDEDSEAISTYFESGDELNEEDLQKIKDSQSQAVVIAIKIQMDWEGKEDPRNLSQSDLLDLMSQSDTPHEHYPVPDQWAHRLLEKYHWGHQILANKTSDSQTIFSVIPIDSGYQCDALGGALKAYLEGLNGRSVLGHPKIYSLSLLGKEDSKEVSTLMESGAIFGIQQNVFYSSAVLRSAFTDIRYYNDAKGKRIIFNGFMVLSHQIASRGPLLSALLYGVSQRNVMSLKGFKNGVAEYDADYLLSQKNIDGICQKGLGRGLPLYYLKLVENLSQL